MILSDFDRNVIPAIKTDLASDQFNVKELTDMIHWEMIRVWAKQLVEDGILPPYEHLEKVLTYIKLDM